MSFRFKVDFRFTSTTDVNLSFRKYISHPPPLPSSSSLLSEFYYSFPQILHFAPNFPVYLNVYSNYTHPPPLNSRTSTSIVKPRFPRHSRPIILAPKLSSSPVFEINLDSHYSHPFSPPNSSTFRIPRVISKRRKQAGNERRDLYEFSQTLTTTSNPKLCQPLEGGGG